MLQRSKKFIIVTLALLSVLNCAPRKRVRQNFQGALGYCGNNKLGDFDVVFNVKKGTPGFYELKVVTVNTAQPGGSYVRMALVNENAEYVELVSYARIQPDKVLYQGTVT